MLHLLHLPEEETPQADLPRVTTENDLPWLISLGKKRYGAAYDYTTVENWYRNIVLKSPLMFHSARTQNAFAISMISCLPWAPSDFECNIVFICADDGAMWEAMKLLRDSVAWAKLRKCSCWKLSSDTETEIFAMAKRLGATEVSPRYTLRL